VDKEEWLKKLLLIPVRMQWDPERDMSPRALDYRSFQIGLRWEAAEKYVDERIVSIADVTDTTKKTDGYIQKGDLDSARECLP
jgi:hypothetical protein